MTWLRDRLARRMAGPVTPSPAVPAFACTIVKLDRIGDFVLSTGAIRKLVGHFGEARCALVVSVEAEPFARREFPGVACCALPVAAGRLFREIAPHCHAWQAALSGFGCEHLVCLRHQRSFYRDLVLRAIPARRRWWLEAAPFGDRALLELEAAAAAYPGPTEAEAPLELAAHRRLVGAVLRRSLAPEELAPALRPARSVAQSRTVVLAPLANEAIRDLPATLAWSALAGCGRLADATVVVLGSAAQAARLETFRSSAPPAWRERCRVVAGETTEGWIGTIAGAALVLAAESSSAHIACALDRPLVAVLGGGHPGLFAPWSRSARQRWLTHPLPCYGCDWQCVHPEPYCLSLIGTADLISAVHDVLARVSVE